MGRLRSTTRALRRASYVVEAVPMAVAQMESILRRKVPEWSLRIPPDVRQALLGIFASQLESAWEDGASREADLESAISTLQTHVRRLRGLDP